MKGIAQSDLEKRLNQAHDEIAGRDFTKIRAQPPTGYRTAGPVDCGPTMVSEKMGATFAFGRSWLLALQFNTRNLDEGPHAVVSWADGRFGKDALILYLKGTNLSAVVQDCVKDQSQAVTTTVKPEIIDRWIDVKVVHDSETHQLELYIDHHLIQSEALTVVPAIDQDMPFSLGGIAGSGHRYVGQVRNVWLGNFK